MVINNKKNPKKSLKIIIAILFFCSVSYVVYMFSFPFLVNTFLADKDFDIKDEKINNKEKDKELPKEPEEVFPKVYDISIIMAGDALFHEAVYYDGYKNDKFDFKPMLSLIKPIVSKHELAFYNQETILGGREIGLSTYPTFNSPQEVGDAFIDAGFNIVSLANNHTLDRGEQAIINSSKYWNKTDALFSGSAASVEEREKVDIREVNKVKYTMLAYTTTTNGIYRKKDYFVNIYDPEIVKKDIEKVRDQVDVLLVSMHWGNEYTHVPSSSQKSIATYLASLGVDIIIGHHPHVVQPIEYINNTLVIYSLGNIISAQVGIERLTGLLVSLDIQKVVEKEGTKVIYGDPTAELIYTYSVKNVGRTNFKIYPYTMLNNKLLPNYKEYYKNFMNIVKSRSDRVKGVPLEG